MISNNFSILHLEVFMLLEIIAKAFFLLYMKKFLMSLYEKVKGGPNPIFENISYSPRINLQQTRFLAF